MYDVYVIRNKVNDRLYVGITEYSPGRWLRHRNALRRGQHQSKLLQSDWNHFGAETFEHTVIHACPYRLFAQRLERELIAITGAVYNTVDRPLESKENSLTKDILRQALTATVEWELGRIEQRKAYAMKHCANDDHVRKLMLDDCAQDYRMLQIEIDKLKSQAA